MDMRCAWVLVVALASCATPADPAPCPTLEEADQEYFLGDLPGAEAKYRHLLECDVPLREQLRALQRVGECLRRRGNLSEARAVFERVVAWPVESNPWSYVGNVKGWAQMGIGECFEAEGRWEAAFRAYLDSHTKYPVRGECGNGNMEQRLKEEENLERCMRRLVE